MAPSISFDIPVNVSAQQLWLVLVKDSPTHYPEVLPAEHPATVECSEAITGAFRTIVSVSGDGSYIKEQFEEVDEANYSTTATIVEATGSAQVFEGRTYKIKFSPGADESSSIASWDVELEANAGDSEAEKSKERITRFMKRVEAYVLSHDIAVE